MVQNPPHNRVVTGYVGAYAVFECKLEYPGLIFQHLDRTLCRAIAGRFAGAGGFWDSNGGLGGGFGLLWEIGGDIRFGSFGLGRGNIIEVYADKVSCFLEHHPDRGFCIGFVNNMLETTVS